MSEYVNSFFTKYLGPNRRKTYLVLKVKEFLNKPVFFGNMSLKHDLAVDS